MPIYDYTCQTCNKTAEKIVKNQDETVLCPDCGAEMKREVSACAGFVVYGGYLNRYTSGKPHKYTPSTH
jgi:putative FmdB family regulatory protein